MFGKSVVAGILMAAAGCDKQVAAAPPMRRTSLTGKPTTLFLLFGDQADPRLLPVATVVAGRIAPIALDSAGWRSFDQLYFSAGAPVSVYKDGILAGPASIRRGMWTDADVLYKLPGCRSLRPLGAVTMTPDPAAPPTIEMIATSAALPQAAHPAPTPADLDSARAFAGRAAQRGGLTRASRDELELVVSAIQTGATDRPTLVVSYSEKGSGGAQHPRHVFGLADIGLDGYASTFSHAASDSLPEFRRLIDHVDVTGDGQDEIVLEGWRQGGESFLVIMQFVGGRWKEVARGTNSWCADIKPSAGT
jgi:hypothetical protein